MSKYDLLNPEQKEAVFHYEGPLLILAGAGSGKTRVLTHRVAWLIEEKQVNPWNIMAITFTNKAAGEMRDRVETMLGGALGGVWVATFHSTCVRILRRYIDRIGFGTNFTIYDGDDQKTIIKEICKRFQIDTKLYRERFFMAAISAAKDELLSPDDYAKQVHGDTRKQKVAEVYREYQKQLRASNALDFDDLIFRTVELFQKDAEVLEQYQDRFRFIMVDEYQDTNTAQFKLVSLLAAKYRNLCVVGDDDQSIYRFRGGKPQIMRNLMNDARPENCFIHLSSNYRSKQMIVDFNNDLFLRLMNIPGCSDQYTDHDCVKTGAPAQKQDNYPVEFHALMTKALKDQDEGAENLAANQIKAQYIAQQILTMYETSDFRQWKDYVVLVRSHAVKSHLKQAFDQAGIPYYIDAKAGFYQSEAMQILLSWFRILINPAD